MHLSGCDCTSRHDTICFLPHRFAHNMLPALTGVCLYRGFKANDPSRQTFSLLLLLLLLLPPLQFSHTVNWLPPSPLPPLEFGNTKHSHTHTHYRASRSICFFTYTYFVHVKQQKKKVVVVKNCELPHATRLHQIMRSGTDWSGHPA